MSKEWMLKTLTTLGVKEADAQLYVLLTREGPQQAQSIAEALKIYKRKLYRGLEKLQQKGMVNATQERPAQFSAVPFDKVLDFLIRTHLKKARRIEQEKEEIINQWNDVMKKHSSSAQ